MVSGNSYTPTSGGTVLVHPDDVALLLGYGFTLLNSFSGQRAFNVDLNNLASSIINLPAS